MSKKLLAIAALASALFLGKAVFADSVCREGLSKMVQSLHITNDQKTQIQPILTQLQADQKATSAQMDTVESQLNDQLKSDSIDQSKVGDLVDQKVKLIGDTIKNDIKAKTQIFAILTAEQKTKLQGMIKKADDKIAAMFKACQKD